jgi:hypothetical protein
MVASALQDDSSTSGDMSVWSPVALGFIQVLEHFACCTTEAKSLWLAKLYWKQVASYGTWINSFRGALCGGNSRLPGSESQAVSSLQLKQITLAETR